MKQLITTIFDARRDVAIALYELNELLAREDGAEASVIAHFRDRLEATRAHVAYLRYVHLADARRRKEFAERELANLATHTAKSNLPRAHVEFVTSLAERDTRAYAAVLLAFQAAGEAT